MKNIYVTSLDGLINGIKIFKPKYIISTVRKENIFEYVNHLLNLSSFTGEHVFLNMDDLDDVDAEYLKKDNNRSYNLPSKVHIDKMVSLIDDNPDIDRVLFHCNAGISRSTAMAFGSLVYTGEDPLLAFKKITAIRPMHFMNRRILRLWDEKLDIDVKLVDINKEWDEYLGISPVSRNIVLKKIKYFNI